MDKKGIKIVRPIGFGESQPKTVASSISVGGLYQLLLVVTYIFAGLAIYLNLIAK